MSEACPMHNADASSTTSSEASGFGEEMMRVARHAAAGGTWVVRGDPAARLSTARTLSTIPKAATNQDGACPVGKDGGCSEMAAAASTNDKADKWEYPSEKQYFRAMQRKGWKPEAEQMTTLVAIHNAVNEQTWKEVLQWEAMHPTEEPPRLKHFMGKPRTYSPKARLLHLFRGSVLPFDRHDWVVERDGKEVRYVIDYYSGQPEPDQPLSIYLDVRPALDSVGSVIDRLHWQARRWFPSLLGENPSTGSTGSNERQSAESTTPAACPHAT